MNAGILPGTNTDSRMAARSTRRRVAITLAYLFASAISSFLLSTLPFPWQFGRAALVNATLLLTVVLGSAYTVVAAWMGWNGMRYSAWALGAWGAVPLSLQLGAAVTAVEAGSGPALVASHLLIASMGGSLVLAMLLVAPWRPVVRREMDASGDIQS